MFVFTSKAKILAISLTLVGLIMLVIGFNTPVTHNSVQSHAEVSHAGDSHGGHEDHGAANRPWSAFLVNTIFFLGIGVGTFCLLYTSDAADE